MPTSSRTPRAAKLLLADDDPAFRQSYAELLHHAGYRVIEAVDGPDTLDKVEREVPGLVVLDVDMPGMDGWVVLQHLRQRGHRMPILMLTIFGEVDHRVRGLTEGADDYLPKPCNNREFLARIAALLRRGGPADSPPTLLAFGDTVVDLQNRVTTRNGSPVALTKTEYAFLELLANQQGKPVSRATILEDVWGYARQSESRTVETHVWRLRAKLGDSADAPRWIRTVPGIGYQLLCDEVDGSESKAPASRSSAKRK